MVDIKIKYRKKYINIVCQHLLFSPYFNIIEVESFSPVFLHPKRKIRGIMEQNKSLVTTLFRSFIDYWKGSGHDVRRRIAASAVSIVFAVVFCFNLLSFNFDAPYSDKTIKKNRDAVKSYDFSTVKKVESIVKAMENKETNTLNAKTQSKVYYLKKFKNSVILGDSITEGLTVYGYLPDDIVLCAIGASLEGSGALFKKAAKLVPDNAFFTFGMNDLIKYRGKSGPFIKEYSKLLRKFRKKSPDTIIYINSISVPNKDAQKRQPSLKHYKDYNKALKKLCEEEGYIFIDNTYILKKNKQLYAPDGIHVATTYYPIWMNDMITEAGL